MNNGEPFSSRDTHSKNFMSPQQESTPVAGSEYSARSRYGLLRNCITVKRFEKFSPNFSISLLVHCNPCQSPPSLTSLVPLWFIIISIVFSYLSKTLLPGFLQFKGHSIVGQNNSKKPNWIRRLNHQAYFCQFGLVQIPVKLDSGKGRRLKPSFNSQNIINFCWLIRTRIQQKTLPLLTSIMSLFIVVNIIFKSYLALSAYFSLKMVLL